MNYEPLDLSVGDALRPLTGIAKMAFDTALKTPHLYINNPRSMGDHAVEAKRNAENSFRAYLKEKGWERRGWTGIGNDSFLFLDGGTTRGFDLTLQHMAFDIANANRRRKKKDKIQPVILMPVPTYGYFIDTPALHGIDVVTVDRDINNAGYLDPEKLKSVIRNCFADNRRIVAYYDCTPHNPLGFVRSADETKTVYDIMAAVRHHYRKQDENVVIGKPHNFFGTTMTPTCNALQDYPILIDDMVYDGLQYDHKQDIPAFCQVENDLTHVVTLMGLSKVGLSGLRAGIVVAGDQRIKSLHKMLMQQSYFPSYTTLAAVEHFYAASGSGKTIRDRSLTRLNNDHRFNGLLLKAMINGIDTIPELTAKDRNRIIKTAGRHYGLSEEQVVRVKLSRIKGAKIMTTPQAGFFHVLDLRDGAKQSYDDTLAKRLKHDYAVKVAPLGWSSKSQEENIARISFAVPKEQLFDFADRLRICSNAFFCNYTSQKAASLQPVH